MFIIYLTRKRRCHRRDMSKIDLEKKAFWLFLYTHFFLDLLSYLMSIKENNILEMK